MPLADTSPSPTDIPNTVRTTNPDYRNVAVDTRYVPTSSLLTSIEGSSWTVNYYSQVLNSDSALAGQNLDRSAVYQQYRLIKGMELKVTSALTTSQDDVTKSMTVTGSANVYPFLIPNIGDMFIADVGDGRAGIFKITASERRSIFKDTCYAVEYQLIDYSTSVRLGDLTSKVILTLQFVKDFLHYGQNPLLTEEDFAIGKKLEDAYYDLLRYYFKAFTSQEYKTLLMPAQDQPVYDHFLTQALMSVVNTRDAVEILQVRKMNVSGDDAMKATTLWDALLQKDARLLKHATHRTGVIGALTFNSNPMLEGIYYSGISYVVYPKDLELSVDLERTRLVKSPTEDYAIQDAPSRVSLLQDLLSETTLNGLPYTGAPLLNPVLADDYYVFTQAFYEQSETQQSKLELCVRDYLSDRAVDQKLLLTFCDTYQAWGGLERFYYIPILLILIKASVRSI